MPDALAEDRRARESEHAWLLGRFVVPASRLAELGDEERGLSVVADAEASDDRIEAIESLARAAGTSARSTSRACRSTRSRDAAGQRAKVRCGGEHVPSVEELAAFIRGCRERRLVFKATAGLHHAYPTAAGEHGFLNLLAAAVFGDEEDALRARARVVRARRAARSAGAVAALSAGELARVRATLLHSIGSCSFFEPVEELRALEILRERLRRLLAATAARAAVGWRDGDEVVDLSGLGDVYAQPSLNALMALGRDALGASRSPRRARTTGRASRSRRRRCTCRSRSRTTSTSTRRSSMRRTWAASSVPTPSRCCRTGAGFRSATTAAQARSSSAAPTSPPARTAASRRTRTRRCTAPSRRLDIELELGFVVGVPSALGEPVAGGALRRPRLRRRPRQRLERPRHPGVGVRAARAVPRQVVPDVDLRLGDAARAARGAPRRGAAAGAAAAAAPRRRPRLGARHRSRGGAERRVISRGNARTLYWTMPQQLAHATSNGASLRTGDLMASGTISGPDAGLGGLADRADRQQHVLPRGRRRGRAARPGGRARARRGPGPGCRRFSAHPPDSYRGRARLLPAAADRVRVMAMARILVSEADPDVRRLLMVLDRAPRARGDRARRRRRGSASGGPPARRAGVADGASSTRGSCGPTSPTCPCSALNALPGGRAASSSAGRSATSRSRSRSTSCATTVQSALGISPV